MARASTFAGLSRDTYLLAIASFCSDVSTEMLYPVLPVFLTQTLKANGSIVGLIDGLAQAMQNIVQGFAGALSDKLRAHKPIAIGGYLLSAVAKPMMGLAAYWQVFLGARLLDRFGAGSRSAPRDALLAASVDEQHRGKAFGLEGFGDNAGACAGPLVAVLLLYAWHTGLRTMFYLAVIPGLLAWVMVLAVRDRPAPTQARSKLEFNLRTFPRGYWTYLVVTALFGLGNSSNAFLILRAQDAGASLKNTILIYAGYNLVAALISYPAGAMSDRWGRRNILLAGFAIAGAAYAGFAVCSNAYVFAVLFIIYGAYQGIFRAVGKAFASDFAPAEVRASAIGWYSTTVGLMQLVAGLVAGLLWDLLGHAAVFYYGAVFALLGALALWLAIPSRVR